MVSPLQFAVKCYAKDIHFTSRKYSFVIKCNRNGVVVKSVQQTGVDAVHEKLPREGLYHKENVIFNVCNDV